MKIENLSKTELESLIAAANSSYLTIFAATLYAPSTPEFNRLREVNDNLRKALVRAGNHLASLES